MLAKTVTEGGDLSWISSEKSSLCCQSSRSRLHRRDKVSTMTSSMIMCEQGTRLVCVDWIHNVFYRKAMFKASYRKHVCLSTSADMHLICRTSLSSLSICFINYNWCSAAGTLRLHVYTSIFRHHAHAQLYFSADYIWRHILCCTWALHLCTAEDLCQN